MINEVLKNDINVWLSTGIGYLLNLQIKCLELNSTEKKIEDLEKITVHIKLPEALQNN